VSVTNVQYSPVSDLGPDRRSPTCGWAI